MRKVTVRTGNLPRVASLTGNFTSERPLSPKVIEAISAALADGWADPKKLSQASHRALQLGQASLEEIASYLRISAEALKPLGEPNIGHLLAIGGLLSKESLLVSSAVDVGKARAVARSHQGPRRDISVDSEGEFLLLEEALALPGVISIQAANGETGVTTDLEKLRTLRNPELLIALDCTTAPLPEVSLEFADTALFDARSWGGPQGLSILAINGAEKFRYPLPHIAPITTPGSYSLPLLVGSAVAIEEFSNSYANIPQLRTDALQLLSTIDGVSIVAQSAVSQSRHFSLLIERYSSEEVMRLMHPRGFEIDAGSACSPEDLAPSHVIAAMGLPTTGHIRITLHPDHTSVDIAALAGALKEVLSTS